MRTLDLETFTIADIAKHSIQMADDRDITENLAALSITTNQGLEVRALTSDSMATPSG